MVGILKDEYECQCVPCIVQVAVPKIQLQERQSSAKMAPFFFMT